MSFNKSQGQEMESVLLDLRDPVFAHAIAYKQSEARFKNSYDKISIITNPTSITSHVVEHKIPTKASNILHPEL